MTLDSSCSVGVLLVNIGTPDAPNKKDVRKYLSEFLSDPYVITLPYIFRWLLLLFIILPFRSAKSAAAYSKVWTKQGSPLLVNSLACADGLSNALCDKYKVVAAMRYGSYSINDGLRQLIGCKQIVVVPLYPQYADATTRSTIEKVKCEMSRLMFDAKVAFVPAFYSNNGFIKSYARLVEPAMNLSKDQFLLMSYHGLPVNQLPDGDCENCYRAHCYGTSKLLAGSLGLSQDQYSVSFQSRLGASKWIEPYTVDRIAVLYKKGIRKLVVACPSFVADCLETLEEMGISLKKQWLDLGGESFTLVPCLNADSNWVLALSEIIYKNEVADEDCVGNI